MYDACTDSITDKVRCSDMTKAFDTVKSAFILSLWCSLE